MTADGVPGFFFVQHAETLRSEGREIVVGEFLLTRGNLRHESLPQVGAFGGRKTLNLLQDAGYGLGHAYKSS